MVDKMTWSIEDRCIVDANLVSTNDDVLNAMELLHSRSDAFVTHSSLAYVCKFLFAYTEMHGKDIFPEWGVSLELWRSEDNRLHWMPVLSNGDASVRLVDADAPFLMLDNGKQYVRPLHTLDAKVKDFNGTYVTVHTPLKHVLEKWLMSPDKLSSIDEHVACVDAFSTPKAMPEAWKLA